MKAIDREIFEVETRLHAREAALKRAAIDSRRRTFKALKSPVTIVGAALLGFVVAGRMGKRRAHEPAVSQETKEQTKGFALGTLLMTAATWFIRNQFGGPVGFAQFVLSKMKGRGKAAVRPQPVKTAV
jgi:hypothetical protein